MLCLRLRQEDSLQVPGGTKGAMTREEEKETGKDSEEGEDDQGEEDEGTDDSSKGLEDETKSPMKPPAKLEPQLMKCSKADDNEGMEGMADEETSFPCSVEVNCRECKLGGLQTKEGWG